MIYEGLFHLALKERLHDSGKELWVSFGQEEVQLVAHLLVVHLALLFQCVRSPLEEEWCKFLVDACLIAYVVLSHQFVKHTLNLLHVINQLCLGAGNVLNQVLLIFNKAKAGSALGKALLIVGISEWLG